MARASGQPDERVLIEASFTLWVAWSAYGALHVFDTTWGDALVRLLRVLPWPTAELAADRAGAALVPTALFGVGTGAGLAALAVAAASPAWWLAVAYHLTTLAFCAAVGLAGAFEGARAVQRRTGLRGAAESWLAAPAMTFVAMVVGVLVLELAFLEAIRATKAGDAPLTRAFWVALSLPMGAAAFGVVRAAPLRRQFELLHAAWIETEEAMSNRWGQRAAVEPLVPAGSSEPRADVALRAALERGLARRSPLLAALPWAGAAAAVGAAWSTRFAGLPAWGAALAVLGVVAYARRSQRLLASHGVDEDGFLATIAPLAQVQAAVGRVLRRARRFAALPVLGVGFALVAVDGGATLLASTAAACVALQRRPPTGRSGDGAAAVGASLGAAALLSVLPQTASWPTLAALLGGCGALVLELHSWRLDRR